MSQGRPVYVKLSEGVFINQFGNLLDNTEEISKIIGDSNETEFLIILSIE